jgi:hypothetical protein
MDSENKPEDDKGGTDDRQNLIPHRFISELISGLRYGQTSHKKDKINEEEDTAPKDPRPIVQVVSGNRGWLDFPSVLTALANCLSALISLGTLAGLIYTVKFAKAQWEQMSNQTTVAMCSLNEARAANHATLQISKQSLQDVQRAFVFPNPILTPKKWPNGQANGESLDVIWQNSGETPAMRVSIETHYAVSHETDFEKIKKSPGVMPAMSGPANIYLSPKASYKSHIENIPQAVIETLGGTDVFYLWGSASYRDVFQGTKIHTTQMCYYLFVMGIEMSDPQHPAIRDFQTNQCPTGNCIDDECKVKK